VEYRGSTIIVKDEAIVFIFQIQYFFVAMFLRRTAYCHYLPNAKNRGAAPSASPSIKATKSIQRKSHSQPPPSFKKSKIWQKIQNTLFKEKKMIFIYTSEIYIHYYNTHKNLQPYRLIYFAEVFKSEE